MNVYAIFADHVREAVAALAGELPEAGALDLSRIVVEPPRDAAHGDLATNAAMVLAKDLKMKPRDLAEKIAARLAQVPNVAKVDVAGPGFINLTLDAGYWPGVLAALLRAGTDFGRSDLGGGEAVNVEYVSANPTGPMHVGHCRGAVFGDALASLLAFAGFKVTREYYINDAGAQVDVLARSAYLRYREAATGETVEIPDGLYPGDYLVPVGKTLAEVHGSEYLESPESEWLPIFRTFAIGAMMEMIRDDLQALGISFDVFFSERSLTAAGIDRVGLTIEQLRRTGEVYEGRLPPPKGAPIEDWEDREQSLFRSTAHGDDVDRPLVKSDGSYTYFAGDIAYHKDKFDRGFRRMIDVWGADHGGYVKRMQAAVKAVTAGQATLDVELCQLVRLLRNGEQVRMSKRAGSFVTLREVVDEVGRDAVRFMMLFRKNDATLDFDLAKVIEQSRENPVFYVQYAHARAQSILRNAKEQHADLPESGAIYAHAPLDRLTDEGELGLVKRLAGWPRLVEQAAHAREPHRVAFYLHEVASEFHGQWNRGKDLPHLRFIIENDRELTMARLALVHGVAAVLASGLGLLGVEAVDEMK
ncbi:arginyl-tRNA synthetase [Azorhizobium caulinodans ORS 571]|uniref:Arginine--tRNA ligase n=1 Tax=Azorhizobium caulinodans (strain ATCC 43989 / DSM 5975 / JCM 20966 / LMG 6465 / NBRC 14845 / NCIMB 13405 / ORS 571) TaxID=438753 RepID=SYR_AZOC5|nr:arginine--tRNA ligase [Azorhizobium caulinodans]A8I9L7.1 RecName: Full=Arginine--tRNA ligase; AltName: Full=Arginyl-tRNA synthetase; Short=ArgRS [Azorhizobium caulinodans ORS 571]BAF88804.1 arginyl-tRNA synthetase [Azorhizobium caulinodans ORS 571]